MQFTPIKLATSAPPPPRSTRRPSLDYAGALEHRGARLAYELVLRPPRANLALPIGSVRLAIGRDRRTSLLPGPGVSRARMHARIEVRFTQVTSPGPTGLRSFTFKPAAPAQDRRSLPTLGRTTPDRADPTGAPVRRTRAKADGAERDTAIVATRLDQPRPRAPPFRPRTRPPAPPRVRPPPGRPPGQFARHVRADRAFINPSCRSSSGARGDRPPA